MSGVPEVSLFNVGIHGLRIIGDKRASRARRVVWLFAVVAAFSLTCWYLTDCTAYFISNPMQTSISILERQSVLLPDVTVCSRHLFNMTKLRQLWRDLSGQEVVPETVDTDILAYMNQTALWEAVSYDLTDLVTDCTYMFNQDCLNITWWTPRMTSHGKCFTLRGPEVPFSGEKYGVKIRLNETRRLVDNRVGFMPMRRGWQIAVHPRGVPPDLILIESGITKVVRPERGPRPDGARWDVSEIGRISVAVSQFETLPLGDFCVTDEKYTYEGCKVECLERAVMEVVGCRMSFMHTVDGPACNTKEDVVRATAYLNDVYFHGNWTPASCYCPPQCVETVYRLTSDTVPIRSPPGTGQGRIWVYFQQMTPTVTHISETPSYDFTEWFSDIGGVTNFMMGVSCLTLFEIVDVLCVWFYEYFTSISAAFAWYKNVRASPLVGMKEIQVRDMKF